MRIKEGASHSNFLKYTLMKLHQTQKHTLALRRIMIMISTSILILTIGLILSVNISGHTKACVVQVKLQNKIAIQ